ncbi:hypothetical protein ACFX11_026077 [Malus domestica]
MRNNCAVELRYRNWILRTHVHLILLRGNCKKGAESINNRRKRRIRMGARHDMEQAMLTFKGLGGRVTDHLKKLRSFQNSTENTKPRSLNSLDNVSKAGHPVLSRGSRWIQYAFAAANLQGFGFGRRWRSVTMIGVRRCVDDPSVAQVFNSALNFARTVYPVCTPDAPDISNKLGVTRWSTKAAKGIEISYGGLVVGNCRGIW